MKRIACSWLWLSLFMGFALGQGQFQLPRIVNGDGIQTTFLFFNNGAAPSVVFLSLNDADGSPLAMNIPGLTNLAPGTFTLNLNPGQSLFATSDGQGSLQAGAATVTSTGSLGVSAVISLFGGTTEAGISSSESLSSFCIPVDLSGAFNTGLAVQNLSGSQTTLTFTLFNSNGVQQGAAVTRDLPADGNIALFVGGVGGLFENVSNLQGKLGVTATSNVAALTLRQELTRGVLTTLPVIASGSVQTEFNLPQVANGGGIKTTFVFFGLGQAANAQLTLTQDNGSPFAVGLSNGQNGSQFDLNVPANGALFLETDGLGASALVGAAQVTSNAPIGVSSIFTIVDVGGNVLTEAGVGDSPALTEFTLPLSNLGVFDTGLALFNPNPATANLQFTFFNPSGVSPSSLEFKIAPFGLGPINHLAQFLSEMDPSLEGVDGTIAVTSSLPVSALGLRQNTSLFTLTSLPVAEGVPDAGGGGPPPMGGDLLLPRIETVADLTQNRTQDIVLPPAFEISGAVTTPGLGSFVLSVAALGGGESFGGVFDIVSNRYRIGVPAGSFEVLFCYTAPPPVGEAPVILGVGAPQASAFLEHSVDVTVNGDTTRDVVLPNLTLRNFSGVVSNLGELPPELQDEMGLGLIFTSDDSPSAGLALVQDGGAYSGLVTDGSYTATLFAGDIESVAAVTILFDIGQFTINGDGGVVNLAVPDLVTLSGTVTSPIAGLLPDDTFVAALDATGPLGLLANCIAGQGASVSAPNPASGAYMMPLIRNRSYRVNANLPVTSIGTPDEGSLFIPQLLPAPEQFNLDTLRDFNFPNPPAQVTLSGRVTDSGGNPVADADVEVFSENLQGTPNAFFSAGTDSDASGNYSITVLSGFNYRVEAEKDPAPPGFGLSQAEIRKARKKADTKR